jgi:small-conductance mechanosensitive channel
VGRPLRRLLRAIFWIAAFALTLGVWSRVAAGAPHPGKTKDASSDAALRDAAADTAPDSPVDAPNAPDAADAGLTVTDDAEPSAEAGQGAKVYVSPSNADPDGSAWVKPSPSASASTAPSSSAAGGTPVRIHDRTVFFVRIPRGGQSASERAAHASQALEHALEDTDPRGVRVEENGDVAVVFLGETPIIQLGPDDATAEGDASLGVHAAAVASNVQAAVAKERKRSALGNTFFSISLLVFSALIAFLVLGRLSALVDKIRAWIEAHPDRLPNVRFARIDVIRPAALHGGVLVAIDASKWVLRLGVAYVWLLFALSLFEATRIYSERLTGFVFAPLSALMGRAASALPVGIVFAITGLAVALLVRFVALFFGSVARGETTLPWLPADLAGPTSVLVRAGIVLVAITFAAPLVTGSEEGSLARAGAIALIALGLSVTPVLATATIGAWVVFDRRLRVGDFAEVGGRRGVIRAVSLLEVLLEDDVGCEVRVPHLFGLLHPTRVLGPHPPVTLEVVVAPGHAPAKVRVVLEQEAKRVSERFTVALDWIDATGAGYSIVVHSGDAAVRSALLAAISEALVADGIELGRRRPPSS